MEVKMKSKTKNFFHKNKNPNYKYFHFSKYTFLKCFPLNFVMGFIVFFMAALFIKLPFNYILSAFFNPVLFVAILVSGIGCTSHILITRKISNELMYWKLHKMDMSESTRLLNKVQTYPLIKGFETFVCFCLCGIITVFYVRQIFNVDEKFIKVFFTFIFFFSYFYGMIIVDITNKDCSSFAVEIVQNGVYVDESKLNYKMNNIFLFFMYIGNPIIIAIILFILTAILSYQPVIIHPNNLIASKTLSELESQGIFFRQQLGEQQGLYKLIFVAVCSTVSITILAYAHFNTTTKYNKKLQEIIENLFQNNKNLSALNLPVSRFRDSSYTMHLLDQTILTFNNFMQNNDYIENIVNVNTNYLLDLTNESIERTKKLKGTLEPYYEQMQILCEQPKINENKLDDVILVSSKMIEDIEISFKYINNNIKVMQEITRKNQETISEINTLSNKVSGIWEIINLIDNISDQTKIIAFNSELEANNIDSENKNFKNIAKDIRNLANKTSGLTEKIRKQINAVLDCSRHLIFTSKKCMELINQESEISKKLLNNFNQINLSIRETKNYSNLTKEFLSEQFIYFTEISNQLQKIKDSVNQFQNENDNLVNSIQTLKKSSDASLNANENYQNQQNENSKSESNKTNEKTDENIIEKENFNGEKYE